MMSFIKNLGLSIVCFTVDRNESCMINFRNYTAFEDCQNSLFRLLNTSVREILLQF